MKKNSREGLVSGITHPAASRQIEAAFFINTSESIFDEIPIMKQQVGTLIQLFVLGALPTLIVYQLTFGIPLIVMPACLLVGVVLFSIGTRLREN